MKLHLPEGYRRNPPAYFPDQKNKDEWNDACYRTIREREGGEVTVLDFGCGSAYKLLKWWPTEKVTGLDVVRTVEWLRKHKPQGRWITSLPRAEKWDVVIAVDVLEHCDRPDLVLSRLRNKAKHYYFSTPQREKLRGEYDRQLGPPRNWAHCQEWSAEEFADFLAEKYEVVQVYSFPPHTGMVLCVDR